MRYTVQVQLADRTWEENDTDKYPTWDGGLLEVDLGATVLGYPVLNVRKFIVIDNTAESEDVHEDSSV